MPQRGAALRNGSTQDVVDPAAAPSRRPRNAAGASVRLHDEEAGLLRRIGYLQHATDPQRTEAWSEWLSGSTPPDSSTFTRLQKRLAMQLLHGLNLRPPTLAEGFQVLWRHRAVRDEIAELLALTRRMIDASPAPLFGLGDVPLMAHARYTRAEVLAATGVSDIDRTFPQQTGVHFEPFSRMQLMFVTLHKDNARFSSTTQYKDHAIARDLFHWESQTGASKARRCGNASAPVSTDRDTASSLSANEVLGRSRGRFGASGRSIFMANSRGIDP